MQRGAAIDSPAVRNLAPAIAARARRATTGAGFVPLLGGRPEIASALYRGRFPLGGREVVAEGGRIFTCRIADHAALDDLLGFSWLAHLEASDRELHRIFARGLVEDWMAERRFQQAPPVVARRVINLVRHAPFLFEGAGGDFIDRFTARLGRDLASLGGVQFGPARVTAAIALATAAIGLGAGEAEEAQRFARLDEALNAEILPDGGPRSRDSADLVTLLLDLLPLRAAAENHRAGLPHGLHAAIERMLPMVRFFRHGDGGLGAFAGTRRPMIEETRAVLDADSSLGLPLGHAPHTGYARLQAKGALAIADTGGGLDFEFSDGANRIVVNCGAAHRAGLSTLDGESPAAAASDPAGYVATPEGTALRASRRDAARIHERSLFLSPGGDDLRGEDIVGHALGPRAFALRFHLHPAVKATLAGDGASIVLQLPNRAGWRFCARGARPALEESLYGFGLAEPRRTRQIVLAGDAARARIVWAFKRDGKPANGKSGPGEQLSLDWT